MNQVSQRSEEFDSLKLLIDKLQVEAPEGGGHGPCVTVKENDCFLVSQRSFRGTVLQPLQGQCSPGSGGTPVDTARAAKENMELSICGAAYLDSDPRPCFHCLEITPLPCSDSQPGAQ